MASRKLTTENITNYKQARTVTKKVILQTHKSYVNELTGNVKTYPAPFYKYIRPKRTESAGISSLTSEGTFITADRVKATAFRGSFPQYLLSSHFSLSRTISSPFSLSNTLCSPFSLSCTFSSYLSVHTPLALSIHPCHSYH